MTRKDLRILVTGGAGFIGSHIVDRLLAENIAYHEGRKEFHFVKGDIRDLSKVKEFETSETLFC